jgi:hypothetical protein
VDVEIADNQRLLVEVDCRLKKSAKIGQKSGKWWMAREFGWTVDDEETKCFSG